jgi:hypothetical protein
MLRSFIVALALAIIFTAIVFGGCSGEMAGSTITGNVSDNRDSYNAVSGVLISAVPADGGAPVHAISDDNGNYSLNVKPGIRYNMSGMCYDPYGQYSFVEFRYPNEDNCYDVTLAPGETVALITFIYRLHPPMSFFMMPDPVTGYMNFTPSTPVSISGHIYLDGKAVSGAFVEAISAYGRNRTSTVTDDSGTYSLGLDSRTQYNITATYQGMRHTVWPVFVYDNETGVYDINLTRTPRSIMTGAAPSDEPWLRHPDAVTIEATPVGGGTPVTASIGPDFNYSLDLEPLTYYDISGKFRGSDGNYYNLTFKYRTGIVFSGFMLRPDETALVDYFTPESYAYLEVSPVPSL